MTLRWIPLLMAMVIAHSLKAEEVASSSATLEKPSFEVIPFIGGTSFTISGGDEDASYRSGFQAGALAAYSVSPSVAMEVGLTYLEMGSEQDFFFAKMETVIQSIAVPLYARWSFAKWDQNDIFLRAGVITSFITSAKNKGTILGEEAGENSILGDLNRLQVLGSAGLGTSFRLSPQASLIGDLSYLHGFTKVAKEADGRLQGFGLNVGVALSL